MPFMKRFYIEVYGPTENAVEEAEDAMSDAALTEYANSGLEDEGITVEYGNDDIEPSSIVKL